MTKNTLLSECSKDKANLAQWARWMRFLFLSQVRFLQLASVFTTFFFKPYTYTGGMGNNIPYPLCLRFSLFVLLRHTFKSKIPLTTGTFILNFKLLINKVVCFSPCCHGTKIYETWKGSPAAATCDAGTQGSKCRPT